MKYKRNGAAELTGNLERLLRQSFTLLDMRANAVSSRQQQKGVNQRLPKGALLTCVVCMLFCLTQTEGFVQGSFERRSMNCIKRQIRIATFAAPSNAEDGDELQVNKELAKAKLLIEKSKAKMRARDETSEPSADPSSLPFFANMAVDRKSVVKTVDAKTGLVTADGEAMAAISEQEDWEVRPLYEVFNSEVGEKEDVYSVASQQLAQRDVAASVWNLRKQLQQEDYQKIFDKRNRFIGEDV